MVELVRLGSTRRDGPTKPAAGSRQPEKKKEDDLEKALKSFDNQTNNLENGKIQIGGRQNALQLLDSFLNDRSENYQKEM